MKVQYQGNKNGDSTAFSIRINGINPLQSSSKYQIVLFVADNPLPIFTSFNHPSMTNCLKEIFLCTNSHQIVLDLNMEKKWFSFGGLRFEVIPISKTVLVTGFNL